ncbi:uncharacterized protein [Diadema antillarum]|uniref:uncharacterized protein n=1 Tax=Diadema antillarum TaxID=105358 RepID=UPI003A8AA11D
MFATLFILTHAAMDFTFPTNSSPKLDTNVVGAQIVQDSLCSLPSARCTESVPLRKNGTPLKDCKGESLIDKFHSLGNMNCCSGCNCTKSSLSMNAGDQSTPASYSLLMSGCTQEMVSERRLATESPWDASDNQANLAEISGRRRFWLSSWPCCLQSITASGSKAVPGLPSVFRKPRLDLGGHPLPQPMPVMPNRGSDDIDGANHWEVTEDEDRDVEKETGRLKSPSRPSRIQYRINSSKAKSKHRRAHSASKVLEEESGKKQKPPYKRSTSANDSGARVVRSVAADSESYQRYASGIRQASQRTERYQDLVNFYANVNKHLAENEKKKAQTLAKKYLPSSAQLERFYNTLHLYMEMEMAADHGHTIVNDRFDELRWSVEKEKGLQKREQNIDDLHSFYTKLDCGLCVDGKSKERLDRLKMKRFADKKKHMAQREINVSELHKRYEGIASGDSSRERTSRKAVSLPATPVKHFKPRPYQEEPDLSSDIFPLQPQSENDKGGGHSFQGLHYNQGSASVQINIQDTDLHPHPTLLSNDPNFSASKYNKVIHQEDLLLMPALVKENVDAVNQSPGPTYAKSSCMGDTKVDNKNSDQVDLNVEYVSPADVESVHTVWNDKEASVVSVQSGKEEKVNERFLNDSAAHRRRQFSEETRKDRSGSSDSRKYQSSSFDQDCSPLTSRSKPVNTAAVKPFQWSDDKVDSTTSSESPVPSAQAIPSPTSPDAGVRQRRDFNPRPRPFSSSHVAGQKSPTFGHSDVSQSQAKTPEIPQTFSPDKGTSLVVNTCATNSDIVKSSSLSRSNLSLPVRSLSTPEGKVTPSVVIRSPSSEEDEWLETYDKVKDSWEESISAYEARQQEGDRENGSSQNDASSVFSFGGAECTQTSDLSHWNMDDDLLTRSLPRNFKLNYGKGYSKLIRQDANVDSDAQGSWEVFTEPQEDELYRTTPTTCLPFDRTRPVETDIRIPKQMVQEEHMVNTLPSTEHPPAALVGGGSLGQQKAKAVLQDESQKISGRAKVPPVETSSVKVMENEQSKIIEAGSALPVLPLGKSSSMSRLDTRSKQHSRKSGKKGPPPPYNPNWSKKQQSPATPSSPRRTVTDHNLKDSSMSFPRHDSPVKPQPREMNDYSVAIRLTDTNPRMSNPHNIGTDIGTPSLSPKKGSRHSQSPQQYETGPTVKCPSSFRGQDRPDGVGDEERSSKKSIRVDQNSHTPSQVPARSQMPQRLSGGEKRESIPTYVQHGKDMYPVPGNNGDTYNPGFPSQPSFMVARSRQLPPYYARREDRVYDTFHHQIEQPRSQQQPKFVAVDDDTGEAYYRASPLPDPYMDYDHKARCSLDVCSSFPNCSLTMVVVSLLIYMYLVLG